MLLSKISNILIGARKDLLNADMMLDDAPQNLDGANTRYPVLFRQPWNYGKTGLLSVSTYAEFLTLVSLRTMTLMKSRKLLPLSVPLVLARKSWLTNFVFILKLIESFAILLSRLLAIIMLLLLNLKQ